MNIFSSLAKNLGRTEDDMTDEEIREAKRAEQKKHDRSPGPRKVRYMTNGQVRRMQARLAQAEHRKTNRRYRRDWMAKQQALSNLRGRLAVTVDPNVQLGMAKLKGHGIVVPADSPLRRNVERGLEREFGKFDPETGELTNDPRQEAIQVLAAANRANKA